jgi:hypothetical protein
MANLTKAERYNRNLDRIFDPEIKKLKMLESVAEDIFNALNEKAEIDPCGLEHWQVINLITKVLKEKFVNLL